MQVFSKLIILFLCTTVLASCANINKEDDWEFVVIGHYNSVNVSEEHMHKLKLFFDTLDSEKIEHLMANNGIGQGFLLVEKGPKLKRAKQIYSEYFD